MSITLHWISGSPFAWRVQFALELKGMPYVSHRMDSAAGEHRAAPFLRLNPRGKVPVLTDGDFALYESVAILAYLDRIQPEVPIFGETAQQMARVWQRIAEFDNYTSEVLSAEVVRPLLQGRSVADPVAARAGADRAHAALAWVQDVLSTAPYLAGDRLTAADIVAMPQLQMLARVGRRPEAKALDLGLDDLSRSHPAVADWLARIAALPAYDASYPPHWRG